jgi:hypothetical protein
MAIGLGTLFGLYVAPLTRTCCITSSTIVSGSYDRFFVIDTAEEASVFYSAIGAFFWAGAWMDGPGLRSSDRQSSASSPGSVSLAPPWPSR